MSDSPKNTTSPKPIVATPLVPEEGPPDSGIEGFVRVREYYLSLLQDLDWDLGPEYKPPVGDIRKEMEQAGEWKQLQRAADQLRQKLNSFVRLTMNEREESSKFILEVIKRLGDVEAHLKASARGAAAIYKENEGLATSMIGNIGEVRHQTETSVNLNEVKSLVLDSLDKFKVALETNRHNQRRHLKTVSQELDQMQTRFRQVQDKLCQMEDENKNLSCRLREDPLTGAHNRIALEERLHQELGLFRRGQGKFSLFILDLDHFKLINDSYGHALGDKCLKEVAATIKKGIRSKDMLARYGGDEFVVVMPEHGIKEALSEAERLRRLVAGTTFSVRGHKIPVTLSVGVAEVQKGDATPRDIFTRADQALYQAKETGRNKVHAS